MTDWPIDGGMQFTAPAEQPVVVGFGLTVLLVCGTVPTMACWAAAESGARAESGVRTLVYLPIRSVVDQFRISSNRSAKYR